MKLRLATRGSQLAWGQSDQVADQLRALGHEVELVKITTHGDVSTAPLTSMGGAGVFVGAVRAAVLAGDADFAVHSFKDLPTAAEPGLTLAAVPMREDPADALCTADGRTLAELPSGAKVGTGSPRRAAQLRLLRPDLETVEIRGNVETRLARASTDLDAVILAAAGLRRLALGGQISESFDLDSYLPAPAQGALAIECRSDAADVIAALAAIDHRPSRLAAIAERAVLAGLQAGCAAPVGAHAKLDADQLQLAAIVVAVDGSHSVHAQASASADDAGASAAGAQVVADLLGQGAAELVDLGASKPKPLTGRRILLPSRTPSGLTDALREAGAELTLATFTEQVPLPNSGLKAALAQQWDWVVFSSPAAVRTCLDLGIDMGAALAMTKVATVGSGTAAALTAAGVEVSLVPEGGGGSALAAAFPHGPGRILLPGAEHPSEQPIVGLTERGWTTVQLPIYRTVFGQVSADVVTRWQAGAFDAVVITAASIAQAAISTCGLPAPTVIAIGQPSASAAREAGLKVAAIAATPDAVGLFDAILTAFPGTLPPAQR
jgi:hydroxymethylbilane synthase